MSFVINELICDRCGERFFPVHISFGYPEEKLFYHWSCSVCNGKNESVILPFNTILQRKVVEENNGMDEIKKVYMPKFQRENKDSLLSRVGSNHEHEG
jgi:hypothetical protein